MNRTKFVQIRVTPMELEQIKAKAKLRQKSMGEYLRWLVDRDSVGEPRP